MLDVDLLKAETDEERFELCTAAIREAITVKDDGIQVYADARFALGWIVGMYWKAMMRSK
ncbi:hypothetical protein ES703_125890 [subsurface metagenome]